MKKTLTIIFLFLNLYFYAQNEFLYNFNKEMMHTINPSWGNDFKTKNLFFLNKTIFIRNNKKPNIQVLSFNLPINKKNLLIIFNLVHNQSGAYFTNNYLQSNFAYKAKLRNSNSNIVFGTNFKCGQFVTNVSDVILIAKDDASFPVNRQSTFGYDFAAGLTLNTKKIRIGFGLNSIMGLSDEKFLNQNAYAKSLVFNFSFLNENRPVFNIHARMFNEYNTIIEPSLNLFNTKNSKISVDLGSRFNFFNKGVPTLNFNSFFVNFSILVNQKVSCGLSYGSGNIENNSSFGNSEQFVKYVLNSKMTKSEKDSIQSRNDFKSLIEKNEKDKNFCALAKYYQEFGDKYDLTYAEKLNQLLSEYPCNNYVNINGETWTNTNANILHLANGDVIPIANNIAEWNEYADKNEPAVCYYNFSKGNIKFGAIYNKFAIEKGLQIQKNFRIPSINDWTKLSDVQLLNNVLTGFVMVYKKNTLFNGFGDLTAYWSNDIIQYVQMDKNYIEEKEVNKEFNSEKTDRLGFYVRLIGY